MKRGLIGVCLAALAAMSWLDAGRGRAEPVADADEAALKQAKQQELEVNEVFDSREMAHAASREIARAERARVETALRALRNAGLDSKAQDSSRRGTTEAWATLRAAVDEMISVSKASTRASLEAIESEREIRAKYATIRQLEKSVMDKRATAAERAGDSNAGALRRAFHEVEAQVALENQQWPNIRKDLARELVEQSGESARIAREVAKIEQDAARRQGLESFAGSQSTVKSEAEALVTRSMSEMEAATAAIYPLKAAAMGGLKLLPTDQWDRDKARHLLVRAGFGGTPQEVRKLHEMGLYKAVDYLVEYARQAGAATAFDPVPPTPADSVESRVTLRFISSRLASSRTAVERGQVAKLRQSWLQRMVESPRPLQEKMALFWHGIFASQESVVQNSYAMHRQNELFREHAAGNYAALLYGIVHDPAMLRYLDNNQNIKGQPNENLAREIMELFSMGVDQGYSEKDIVEAARSLTGYTYDQATGVFRFLHENHDWTNKTIFGQTGTWTGDDLVRLILQKPETARFIARRLIEFFAYPEPEAAVVETLATALRVSNYELQPVLKNLLMSEEFYSPRSRGRQIKSPVELVTGLMRDLGIRQIRNYGTLDSAIQQMGMQLLEPPDVKGWRYGRSWINSQRLFVRYNMVANLIQNVQTGAKGRGVDVVSLVLEGGCKDSGQVVDYLAGACLLRPLAQEKRQELLRHLGDLPDCSQWNSQKQTINERLRSLLVLMLCMPEYQMT